MESQEPLQKRLSMVAGGHKLEIITEEICDGEWLLCVENCHGVRSVWFEYFANPDAALAEGRRTIMEEGVEAFVSVEGFEYLLWDP